jgi:hypothetical protein
MTIDETKQDVDLENNEGTGQEDQGTTPEGDKDTKGKILVDRGEYFKLKQQAKTTEPQAEPKEAVKATDPVTHEDLYKMNERMAVRIATTPQDNDPEDVAAIKAEINDNYEEVTKFYTAKSGKNTPEDIVEDLFDAHAAWKRRNAGKGTDASKRAVSEALREGGVRGSSPSADTKAKTTKFDRPKEGLKNWY